MAKKVLKFRVTSEAPILFHNGRLADPMDDVARQIGQISKKKNKTEADYEEMARLEWLGGLYCNEEKRLIIPGNVWNSALVSGARKLRMGPQVQSGVLVKKDSLLEFDGDKMPLADLWKRNENRDRSLVSINKKRIMRTRFKAREWACDLEVEFDDSQLNPRQVEEIVRVTGSQCGVCDYRPRHGRYNSKVIS
jgi:hypothetical protein